MPGFVVYSQTRYQRQPRESLYCCSMARVSEQPLWYSYRTSPGAAIKRVRATWKLLGQQHTSFKAGVAHASFLLLVSFLRVFFRVRVGSCGDISLIASALKYDQDKIKTAKEGKQRHIFPIHI